MRIVKNKRIALWAHLVSRHAVIIGFNWTLASLLEHHAHEHNGPGGIRNHDEADRSYTLKKLGQVLSEDED